MKRAAAVEGRCSECNAGCVNPHEKSRHHHDWCSLFSGERKPRPHPFVVGGPDHRAVWDAIQAYVRACGGVVDRVSVGRMNAVADVERALEDLCRS